MELIKFKEYLKGRLKTLNKDLIQIETEISSLPSVKDFDMTKYGSKSYFLHEYFESKPKRLFGIKIKPSSNKLQEFAHSLVYQRLYEKKDKLKNQIEEILTAIKLIDSEGNVLDEIYPLNNLLNELLKYCEKNKISSVIFLNMLSRLIKPLKKDKNNVEKIILCDIADYFDEEGNLVKTLPNNNLVFIIHKLLTTLNINLDDSENRVYLNHVTKYLNSLVKKESVGKEELTEQKQALAKLKEYIKNNQIVKLPKDLNEFVKLLSLSGLPVDQQKYYKEKVEKAIKIEEETKHQKEIISTYLTEKDRKIITAAERLILNTDDVELCSLLARFRDDILSLCRYLEFVRGTHEEQVSLEILAQRINSLKIVMHNITNPEEKKRNNFYYLTNHRHIPELISSIETTDITFYQEIYNLLIDLANNLAFGVKIGEEQGVEIYHLYGEYTKITYTKYHDEIVIMSIDSFATKKKEDTTIPHNKLNAAIAIHQTKKDENFKKIHAIYENLIAGELDLTKANPSLTFHPTIK